MAGFEFIQTPGPTNIPSAVLAALSRPPVDFASPEFEELVESCHTDLRRLVGVTEPGGEVFLYAGLGHGAWEATLVNLFAPGQKLLIPNTGVFASSWGQMATDLGFEVLYLENDQRSAIDPTTVYEALTADRKRTIAGVLVTHTETATGVTSDLVAIQEAIAHSAHPALVVVDAVASLATTPLHMTDLGVDAVIAAGQKGLMLTPGLAFTTASARAVERSRIGGSPRGFWSWPTRLAGVGYQKFCGTPPVQQLFALRVALDLIEAEGLEQVINRHHRLAGAVRAAVEHWGKAGALTFNALLPAHRSDSVTCVRVAEGVDAIGLRTELRERWHVSVGGGLGDLAGKAFRVGHLGALNEPMVLGVIGAIELALASRAILYQPGGTTAAIDHLAETSSQKGMAVA